MKRTLATLAIAALIALPQSSQAMDLQITVENLSPTDGFFLTPTWFGFHSGDFDVFNVGEAASASLEAIAEDGIVDGLQADFDAPGRIQGVVTGPAGFGSSMGQPPLIDTGEVATAEVTTINPAAYRYFSFASMVIPSNDAFIGNDNPFAYEVFDAAGNFNGELVIEIFGSDIWDSGTEVNDTLGAAFSTIGGVSSDEGGVVQVHPGLTNFEGTGTPVGTIGTGLAPGSATPVARITISQVPEPTTAVLAVLGIAGVAMRRRS